MNDPTIDDCVAFLIDISSRAMAGKLSWGQSVSAYGYDVYIPGVLNPYLAEVERNTEQNPSDGARGQLISRTFYEAAWQLCKSGVLRPGIRDIQGQATADGSAGNGDALTEFGRNWIRNGIATAAILPIGRLSSLFASLGGRLGDGFVQRSSEAVLCHRMGAYLASCTMSGAAAESVLLAVAVAKVRDEAKVLGAYRTASGRKQITQMVVSGLKPGLANAFTNATGLLAYWRDEAAHGLQSSISEIEAHEALGRLLRFAQFTNDHWAELTYIE